MKTSDLEIKVNGLTLAPIDIEVHLVEPFNYVIVASYMCDLETYMLLENTLTLKDKQFIKLGYRNSVFKIREKFKK